MTESKKTMEEWRRKITRRNRRTYMTYFANVYEALNDPIVFVSRVFLTEEEAKQNIKENLNEDCSFVQTNFIKTISFTIP